MSVPTNPEAQRQPTSPEQREGAQLSPEQQRKQRIEELRGVVDSTIQNFGSALKDLPSQHRDNLKNNFYEYFLTTLDSKNVPNMTREDFENYKSTLRARVEKSLHQLGFIAEEAKKKAEQVMTEEAKKQKEEIERIQKMSREQLQESLERFTLNELPDLNLDNAEPPIDPENPEPGLQAQLALHADNFDLVQKAQANLLKLPLTISTFREKAQEDMKIIGDTANAAMGAAAGVAGAIAVGAAVGSVVPGIGTVVVGALAGAIAAVAIYGFGRGAAAEAMKAQKQKEANLYNTVIKKGKDQYEEGKTEMEEAIAQFEDESAKLNDGPESLREEGAEIFAERFANIERQENETEQERIDRIQQIQDIFGVRRNLADQQDDIEEQIQEYEEQSARLGENRAAIEERQGEVREGIGRVGVAIPQLTQAIEHEQDPVRRATLEQRLEELTRTQQTGSTAIEQLAGGGQMMSSAADELEERSEEMSTAVFSIEDYDGMLTETEGLLVDSIAGLDQHLMDLGLTEEDLHEEFDATQDALTKLDTEIADRVLDLDLANVKGLTDLDVQSQALVELPKVEPEGMGSSLSQAFEGFATGTKFVFGGIADGLSWIASKIKAIPYVGEGLYWVSGLGIGLDITAGIIGGAGDLISGIGTMCAHPVQTWDGIKALFGGSDKISAGDAWGAMGKAIVGWEEFEKGNIGRGIGKGAFNIGLFFVGGAGAGVKAFQAASLAGEGVIMASLRAAAVTVGTSLKDIGTGLVKAPGAILRGGGRLLTAPMRIARWAKMTPAARLAQKTAVLADDVARAGAVADDFARAGKVPESLVGKTPDEIANILKDPALRAEQGLTSYRAIRNAMTYSELVGRQQSLMRGLQVARHAQELAEVDNGLAGLQRVARGSPDELAQFIDDFNSKGMAGDIGNRRPYQVLDATSDGGLVAFDRNGMLVKVGPDDVGNFVANATKQGQQLTGKPLLDVLNNADEARLIMARNVVGPMTPAQEAAFLRAHYLEAAEGGVARLAPKVRELKAAGFTKQQIDKLMRSGLTGDRAAVNRLVKLGEKPGVVTEAEALALRTSKNFPEVAGQAKTINVDLVSVQKDFQLAGISKAKGGVLHGGTNSPVQQFLRGESRGVNFTQLDKEIARVEKYLTNKRLGAGHISEGEQYLNVLRRMRGQGRILTDHRKLLANQLGFEQGQVLRPKGTIGGRTYPQPGMEYQYSRVGRDGYVVIKEYPSGTYPVKGVSREIRIPPERLRQFKGQAPAETTTVSGAPNVAASESVTTPGAVPKPAVASPEAVVTGSTEAATVRPPPPGPVNGPITAQQQAALTRAQNIPHRGPLNPIRPFGEAHRAYGVARAQNAGRVRASLSGADAFLENLPLGIGYGYTIPRNLIVGAWNKAASALRPVGHRLSRAGRLERAQAKLTSAQEQLTNLTPGTLEHTRLAAQCKGLQTRVDFLSSNAPGVVGRTYNSVSGAVGSWWQKPGVLGWRNGCRHMGRTIRHPIASLKSLKNWWQGRGATGKGVEKVAVVRSRGVELGGRAYVRGQPLEVVGVNDQGLIQLRNPSGQVRGYRPENVSPRPVGSRTAPQSRPTQAPTMTPDNIRLARNPNATGRVEQMSLPEMEAALARGELSPELVAQSANEWISANSLNASGRGISPELIQRVGQLRSTAERIAAQPGRIQPRVPEL